MTVSARSATARPTTDYATVRLGYTELVRAFLLVTGLVVLVPTRGHTCTCYFVHEELLTIESVTVDSVPAADLSPLRLATVRPDDYGTPGFSFTVYGTAEVPIFRSWYVPAL